MRDPKDNPPPQRLLVVMPTSLSQCIMATPTLAALRELYPQAHISALIKRRHRAVLIGLPVVDRVLTIRTRPKKLKARRRRTLMGTARRLAKAHFDMTVLLPDNFKAAALASVAAIPRRVGYDRDGRGMLLTDRLIPRKHKGKFVPVPRLDYLLNIARYLGASDPSHEMQLAIDPLATERISQWLTQGGYKPEQSDLLLVAPGGRRMNKRWSPRRFAHLIDMMAEQYGTTAALIAEPGEEAITAEILDNVSSSTINLAERPMRLREIKAAVQMARMVVTNDTGPRHIAAALGVPSLTLFGPSGPEWSHTGAPYEHHLVATGISIAARDDPDFDGRASIDRIRTDTAFDAASALYLRTAKHPTSVREQV